MPAEEEGVLVSKTVSGIEIHVPLEELECIVEIEPVSGRARDVRPHAGRAVHS